MSDLQNVLDFPWSAHRKLLAFPPSSSPTVAEHIRQSSSDANEAALLSDLIVIFVALLCALICALGLNSLLRCTFRCSRQMVIDSSFEVAITVADTGLKKKAMKELPIIVYTATSNPPAVSTDCPICLAEFADGEKLRLMPNCSHSFHVECIDQWLFSHSSCPLCRHSLNLKKKPGGAVIAQATESDNATHTATD